ncbi:hypothetical protein PMI42_00567 [Bradyrhizobium sp. YR681]|uniref:hypothetical protein n=1 Tax=Bradyrhizobium sp. YR681 TaxID=1144344 RepID=UPI0002714822|nr:hypothetical protein [Bradyrhizobium sp. YR681]EJN15802.1 hypothetical protein PMI42_00567 [Bradyrhizobium sp. YR681]
MSAFKILVDLIGYAVARAVLPFLSFGRIYVEPFNAVSQPLRWPCYRRDANGRFELRQGAAGWIGFGICILVLLAAALAIYTAFGRA